MIYLPSALDTSRDYVLIRRERQSGVPTDWWQAMWTSARGQQHEAWSSPDLKELLRRAAAHEVEQVVIEDPETGQVHLI